MQEPGSGVVLYNVGQLSSSFEEACVLTALNLKVVFPPLIGVTSLLGGFTKLVTLEFG